MSVTVPLADLSAAIRSRTAGAYLLSVRDGRPRTMAVGVDDTAEGLLVAAGPRTAASVSANPTVALMWPDDSAHPTDTLIVDGTAEVREHHLLIRPTSALLHRRR